MNKQWVVLCSGTFDDVNYFDSYEDAAKEYEDTKNYLMAEGHESGTQVHLLETIKVATSVIDEERTKEEGSPKENGYDFNRWAKWEELNTTKQ